jgi:penicillin-binding protein 1A
VNLREATVRSYNTVFAQLILDIGTDRALDTAHAMGIDGDLARFPSAVLGANDVQPLEMAEAYATLANRGIHVDPVMVTSVVRADGTILFESEHRQERVLDPYVADQVTDVLVDAVERGTGEAARLDRPVAGKTGTAQAWQNATFCGYVPQLATSVWVGFPGEEQFAMVPPRTPIRVTGGSYPAEIWQRFMAAATAGMPVEPFVEPTPPPTTTTLPPLPPDPTTPPPPGPPVEVPNVSGLPLPEARAALEEAGFGVRQVVDESSPAPTQTVLRQSPAPGTTAPGGGVVTLVVSPPPATTTTTTVAPP